MLSWPPPLPGTGGESAKPAGAVLPNPYLAYYEDASEANYFSWAKKVNAASQKRSSKVDLAANRRAATGERALPPAIVHDEEEPAGTSGSNDSLANSEPISRSAPPTARTTGCGSLASWPTCRSRPRT